MPRPSNDLRVEPAEIADARQRDRHQTIEELVHALAAQRDLAADRHAFAQLELRDRLLRLGDHRLLAGDQLHLGGRGLDRFLSWVASPTPMLMHDLVEPRHLDARSCSRTSRSSP